MARPVTQQERRRDIVEAALALLAEDEATVGIREVAHRLNLTPNAVRYYYRDAGELLWAVRERVEERFLTARIEALAETDDPAEQLARTMGAGLPSGPHDVEWRVTFRPVLSGRVTPDLGHTINEVFFRQVAIYQRILEHGTASGVFVPSLPIEDIARTLMIMEDYQGLRIVTFDPAFDRSDALRLMREYVRQVTGAQVPEIE